MISYEEFLNLEARAKFDYFIEICNKAYGASLKAGQRKNYLRTLSMEDYNYFASLREDFDFKAEYDKIVKLEEISTKKVQKENSVKKQSTINPYTISDEDAEAMFGGWAAEDRELLAIHLMRNNII